jgi:hypothetical protein
MSFKEQFQNKGDGTGFIAADQKVHRQPRAAISRVKIIDMTAPRPERQNSPPVAQRHDARNKEHSRRGKKAEKKAKKAEKKAEKKAKKAEKKEKRRLRKRERKDRRRKRRRERKSDKRERRGKRTKRRSRSRSRSREPQQKSPERTRGNRSRSSASSSEASPGSGDLSDSDDACDGSASARGNPSSVSPGPHEARTDVIGAALPPKGWIAALPSPSEHLPCAPESRSGLEKPPPSRDGDQPIVGPQRPGTRGVRTADPAVEERMAAARRTAERRRRRAEAREWRRRRGDAVSEDDSSGGDGSSAVARQSWMMELPSEASRHGAAHDLMAAMAKRGGRTFRPTAAAGAADASWLESPADRAARALERDRARLLGMPETDSTTGPRRPRVSFPAAAPPAAPSAGRTRPMSLLEKHQERMSKQRSGSGHSGRGVGGSTAPRWDRERDMAIGSRHRVKDGKEVAGRVREAASGLGDRFAQGPS